MQAANRFAGVAPDVNVRITTGDKACKRGIHPGLELRTDVTRSPNRGITGSKNHLCPRNIYNKKVLREAARGIPPVAQPIQDR